jgi:mono/diheme cytochrome c family protein
VVFVTACSPDPSVSPPLPATSESVVRGQQLVEGAGACGFCHSMERVAGAPLAGGAVMYDQYGAVEAPNITVSANGIGSWTESDLKKFLRTSVRPDQSIAMASFHRGMEWMSDSDIGRITAYLRSLPGSDREVTRREVSFFSRNTTGFFDAKPAVRGYIPDISPSFRREYGEYLVDHVARCGSCHSRPGGIFSSEVYLGGGKELRIGEGDGESKAAPNISSSDISGIGGWSREHFAQFFSEGKTPSGRAVDPRFCPVGFYAKAPARDIEAMIEYLRSVPAVE